MTGGGGGGGEKAIKPISPVELGKWRPLNMSMELMMLKQIL